MWDDEVLLTENIGLPAKSNIFQAELRALQLACDMLSNHPIYNGMSLIDLTIFSYSLSSLQALASTEIKNLIVKETHELLNNLCSCTEKELRWINAQNNCKGDKIADQEAKLGTTKPVQFQRCLLLNHIRLLHELQT